MPQEPDTEKHPSTDAPDFLSRLWQWLFQRRTVQIALTYLAAGFAILEFLDIALRDGESADLIMSLARLFYLLGFLLIVFAAPLVFTGTHYFRTGLVAGIVGISLIAGILIRDQFESPGGPAPGAAEPVDNQSVNSAGNDPQPPEDSPASTAGLPPLNDAETTDVGPATEIPSVINTETADTGSRANITPPVNLETSDTGPTTTAPSSGDVETTDTGSATTTASSGDGLSVEVESSVTPDEVADRSADNPASQSIDSQTETERRLSVEPEVPARTTFERLLVLYGESDRVVLDTSTRGQSLFAYSSATIEVRFYAVSGGRRNLYIQAAGARRGERLEFVNIGAKASVSVSVQSGCGPLVYLVEATRIADNEAEVTGRIDRERSQANVQRAEMLEQCQIY